MICCMYIWIYSIQVATVTLIPKTWFTFSNQVTLVLLHGFSDYNRCGKSGAEGAAAVELGLPYNILGYSLSI